MVIKNGGLVWCILLLSIQKKFTMLLNETDMGHVTIDLVFDEINVVF